MPIYNVKDYLHKSLESVLNQTLKDIEIICINDGSTDSSLEIIKEYAARDARIKIIDKKNSGYGHSMNQGMKVATGEYIGILEPDDYMDSPMYEKLCEAGDRTGADVVKANYYEFCTEPEYKETFMDIFSQFKYNTLINPYDNQDLFIQKGCIWSAVYRRDYLDKNRIRFMETPGASFQDTGFIFKNWACTDKVCLIKEGYIHYRIDNVNSSINNPAKIYCVCDEFHNIEAWMNMNREYKDKYEKIEKAHKYDIYRWNYYRIAEECRDEYCKSIVMEIYRDYKSGMIDESTFVTRSWDWDFVNEIIRNYVDEENRIPHGFDENERLRRELDSVYQSKTYKLGHAIMRVPVLLKRKLNHK